MLTPPPTHIRREAERCLTQQDTGGDYPTPACERVWPAHQLPLQADQDTFPMILIYDDKERVTREEGGEDVHALDLELECCAAAKDSEALDDLLDLLAMTIYLAVERNQGWFDNSSVLSMKYEGFDKVRTSEGDRFHGLLTMQYTVEYIIPQPDTTELDDYLHFHGEYDLALADGVIDAQDDVFLTGPEEE